MARFLKPEGIASVLNDHVLEAAASAETCDTVLACVTNRPQRLVHILIRAAGRHPDAGKTLEQSFVYFLCGHPDAINVQS